MYFVPSCKLLPYAYAYYLHIISTCFFVPNDLAQMINLGISPCPLHIFISDESILFCWTGSPAAICDKTCRPLQNTLSPLNVCDLRQQGNCITNNVYIMGNNATQVIAQSIQSCNSDKRISVHYAVWKGELGNFQ